MGISSRELRTCPNCYAEFWTDPSVPGVNVFPCPNCKATLIIINPCMTPTHVKSLAFGVVLYFVVLLSCVFHFAASYDPARFILATFPLAVIGLLILVIVVAYATDSGLTVLQVPASRPKCPRCGRRLAFGGSNSCPSCDPTLPVKIVSEATIGQDPVQARSIHMTLNSKPIGICLVCDLEMDPFEALAGCPHCGNVFHKSHLIEWVRLKKHCPVCSERLAEREIKELSSRVPVNNEESYPEQA